MLFRFSKNVVAPVSDPPKVPKYTAFGGSDPPKMHNEDLTLFRGIFFKSTSNIVKI